METTSKRHSFLKALASFGQLAALFPFAVFFEVLALRKLVVWHFCVIYAVWVVFRVSGWLIGRSVRSLQRRRIPRKIIPLTDFLSRVGFLLPTAVFIVLGIWLNANAAAYFYILPACIIIYFGGNLSVGKSYSDIFSRTWFGLDLLASIATMIAIALSEKTVVSDTAGYILCVGFAAVALLSAVLSNQANIDARTNQRDAGKAVLPEGLRRYNALLVIGIVTLTLGLFVFAKPIASFLRTVIGAVIVGFLYLFEKISGFFDFTDTTDISSGVNTDFEPPTFWAEGDIPGNIVFSLVLAVLILIIVLLRKQIWNAIKSLFEPLFRSRAKTADKPFADEITSSDAKLSSRRARKKAERDLERRYARETSPERKFRLGYAIFLARLRRTEHPPVPSDTTNAHREKGERAFGEDLRSFSETYNKVRYADRQPTADELAAEAELLRRIK